MKLGENIKKGLRIDRHHKSDDQDNSYKENIILRTLDSFSRIMNVEICASIYKEKNSLFVSFNSSLDSTRYNKYNEITKSIYNFSKNKENESQLLLKIIKNTNFKTYGITNLTKLSDIIRYYDDNINNILEKIIEKHNFLISLKSKKDDVDVYNKYISYFSDYVSVISELNEIYELLDNKHFLLIKKCMKQMYRFYYDIKKIINYLEKEDAPIFILLSNPENIHAEMNILGMIKCLKDEINLCNISIGISKLSCNYCYKTFKILYGENIIKNITGTHGKTYPWEIPSFLNDNNVEILKDMVNKDNNTNNDSSEIADLTDYENY